MPTPLRWNSVVTLYGTPRDTPAPDDTPSPDDASAAPPTSPSVGRATHPYGEPGPAYGEPRAPAGYRGTRRAPDAGDGPAPAALSHPRLPEDPLMAGDQPAEVAGPHWSDPPWPDISPEPVSEALYAEPGSVPGRPDADTGLWSGTYAPDPQPGERAGTGFAEYGPNGYWPNEYGANGYGPNGYGANGYGPNGYGESGYGSAAQIPDLWPHEPGSPPIAAAEPDPLPLAESPAFTGRASIPATAAPVEPFPVPESFGLGPAADAPAGPHDALPGGTTGLNEPPPADLGIQIASMAPAEPAPGGERPPPPVPAAGAPAAPAAPRFVDPAPTPAGPSWQNVVIPDDDVGEIAPWDRRPLMIAIAAGVVLVLIAVLSAAATSALFNPGKTRSSWQPGGSSSPGPRPSASAGAAPPVVTDTITLSGVGDVIMGTQPNHLPPNGGKAMFAPVRTALASDLTMGNLETPLTGDTGSRKCGMVTPSPSPGNPSPTPVPDPECFQFYLPPSYANHLRDAGFQVMNLANNHTNDMGSAGLSSTRSALEAVGIRHTGAPNEITYETVKGVKVAVLGFSVYSWGANLNNLSAATAMVRKAAGNADIVVVQMQAGAEGADKSHVKPGHEIFFGEDRGDEIGFTHAVIDAGADVVFGHGPHIMRGMEFYKGRLIAYSLGNFCGYGVLSSSGYLGVGGVLRVTLHKDGTWAGGTLVPTEMVKGGLPSPDSDKRALAFVDGLSTSDFGSTAARISRTDGAITPPTS